MGNRYQPLLLSILFLCIGLLVGWFLWNDTREKATGHDMYQMMSSMSSELEGRSGDDFDIGFMYQMIIHHQGAIDMANLALTNSKNKEIINLAKQIIDSQTKEINQMTIWQKTWYGL